MIDIISTEDSKVITNTLDVVETKENSFVVANSFDETINKLNCIINEIFISVDNFINAVINEKTVTIRAITATTTEISFCDYVDYVICRSFNNSMSFWSINGFSNLDNAMTMYNTQISRELVQELSTIYVGNIILYPIKKIRIAEKTCSIIY